MFPTLIDRDLKKTLSKAIVWFKYCVAIHMCWLPFGFSIYQKYRWYVSDCLIMQIKIIKFAFFSLLSWLVLSDIRGKCFFFVFVFVFVLFCFVFFFNGNSVCFNAEFCFRNLVTRHDSSINGVTDKLDIFLLHYPSSAEGGVTTPLRIIFQPVKTVNFTIKWVQLIVGSSVPVILRYLFLLLIQKYWCYVLETSCVRYNSHFLSQLAKNPIKIAYS